LEGIAGNHGIARCRNGFLRLFAVFSWCRGDLLRHEEKNSMFASGFGGYFFVLWVEFDFNFRFLVVF